MSDFWAVFHPSSEEPIIPTFYADQAAAEAGLAELRNDVEAATAVPLVGPVFEVYMPLIRDMYVAPLRRSEVAS